MLPYTNIPFDYVSGSLGASTDELKLIFSFLLSYPLAALLKRIPDNRPDLKSLFIVATSLFYLVGLFDLWAGVRTLFISSAAAYLISAYIDGPLMPWIGFVFLMGHMSINHIQRRYVNDPSSVDITGAQMVLIMKLSGFCWNVHDGRLPQDSISEFQKSRAISKLPSILDYAGYVLFFPSLMAGPAFDYNEYKAWLDCTMFSRTGDISHDKSKPAPKKRKIPRSGTPAFFKAATGLAWLFAFLQLSSWYYPDVILNGDYLKHNIFRRIFLMHMLGFTTRTKYYAVWSLTEGACILSGIGYNGIDPKTGRADWSRLQNVRPLAIELAQNTRAYLGNWNVNTNNWLRNYIYLRVTPKGKRPGFRASLATFTTSAFWHGFEPGYYLAFILAAFLQTVAKNARRQLRPFVMAPDGKTPSSPRAKMAYDIASWAITQLAFSFTDAAFILLSFEACLTAWARVYGYAIVGTAAAMVFFASPGRVWLKKSLERRNTKLLGTMGQKRRPSAPVVTDGQASDTDGETSKSSPPSGDAVPRLQRTGTHGAGKGPYAGLPDDPGREIDEMMNELRGEVEQRMSKGGDQMSVNDGLQDAVADRLKRMGAHSDSLGR